MTNSISSSAVNNHSEVSDSQKQSAVNNHSEVSDSQKQSAVNNHSEVSDFQKKSDTIEYLIQSKTNYTPYEQEHLSSIHPVSDRSLTDISNYYK